jgi:hypothetical protein
MLRSFILASLAATGALLLSVVPARAVILYSTGSTTANTTSPADPDAGGGWDYEGDFGLFLGTPIAPNYFVTAAHIGGSVGDTFAYGGVSYTTTAVSDDPNSDLAIWKVSGTFPSYAPLYTNAGGEVGQTLYDFGRGTQRGTAVMVNGALAGWQIGASDNLQRWGQNVVDSIQQGMLVANFSATSSLAYECTLSVGDSGGGVFIKQNGIWSLAGINYGVSGPYSFSSDGADNFNAAIFNQAGLYVNNGATPPVYEAGTGPGQFSATEIAAELGFIDSVAGVPEPSSVRLGELGAAGILLWAFCRRRVADAAV